MTGYRVFMFIVLFALTGCESIAYYSQAVSGQLAILQTRQSVSVLINQKATQPKLKERLLLVNQVKVFARESLGLSPGEVFTHYVDTHQDAVIWNVYAAKAFSLNAIEWCYPVAGCVGYRGYFSKQAAVKKAQVLKRQGYDVQVSGIRAYSTLGWFNDPLLNTFIFDDEQALIGLLIHELAHKQCYVKGDTMFNESFATAVEIMGLKRWQEREGASAVSMNLLMVDKEVAFNQFVLSYFESLNKIYRNQTLTTVQKRRKKEAFFKKILQDYDQEKKRNHWGDTYRLWLESLNNAKLATLGNYNHYTRAFFQLRYMSISDKDFYSRVDDLAKLPKGKRRQALDALSDQYALSNQ